MIETIAVILIAVHFGVPLAYYYYLKKRWLNAPWDIEVDSRYIPRVTVIVPTYNESQLIDKKLKNIAEQDYPKDMLEIIVIDSASTDGTPKKVVEWAKNNPELNLKLVEETIRKGKVYALNNALKHAKGEIIIITDADAYWPSRKTLQETAKWFSNPIIGAVSCIKKPTTKGPASIENEYRNYYNTLRIAESKAWSTPIFHGELAAYRKELLVKIGGFSTDIGADDSHAATKIVLIGYRAIIPENIECIEIIPNRNYQTWRIRRAQHLIQHFAKIITSKPKIPKRFKTILHTEIYLHLINPWILLIAVFFSITSTLIKISPITILLTAGVLLLIYKPFRTWITTQLYLIIATLRNIRTNDIVWDKQYKV